MGAPENVAVSGSGAFAGVIKGRLEHEVAPGRAGPESLEGDGRGHTGEAGTGWRGADRSQGTPCGHGCSGMALACGNEPPDTRTGGPGKVPGAGAL